MAFTKQPIALNETSLFGSLFSDYIYRNERLDGLYKNYFNESAFKNYIETVSFEKCDRKALVEALLKQAECVANTSDLSKQHIISLKNDNVYTITTGHQLCLFTGPMYFIYKIISTINLCKALNQKFSEKQFVPVYWMASEDHDFEEINHANVFGKKLQWQTPQKGSVGEFTTNGIGEVIAELKNILGEGEHANVLIKIFENAYLKHNNLAEATRYLVNELFGEFGIVIVDGNDKALKAMFKEEFKKDIFENESYNAVTKTIDKLKANYQIQVNPREINVFYKDNGLRERIEKQGDKFVVLNAEKSFSENEIEDLIENNPEMLSPNVVLRPLYQQKILPNIAYIGGPGELAYWLEYKNMFDAFSLNFPILVPRHFVAIIDKGTQSKLQKLNLPVKSIFSDGEELVKEFIKTQHDDVNLMSAKTELAKIYASVAETVALIDKTLVGTTEAEKQKAVNGISTIEQKINKALKQKSETDVNQIWAIKGKMFPNNVPQERYDNFSAYYSKYGQKFIAEIAEQLSYNLNDFSYTLLIES